MGYDNWQPAILATPGQQHDTTGYWQQPRDACLYWHCIYGWNLQDSSTTVYSTLHTMYMVFFIPVVYALLKDKSAETYYQMFATLRRKMAALNLIFNPTSLMIDFETGILPTLAQHFPNSTVKGCNFHFCQAVWRKVQNLGLVPYYKTGTARCIVKSLMALPFIPRTWVWQAYTTITLMDNGELPAVTTLLKYFKDTWLNEQYSIAMWNVYNQEGWHNALNRSVKKCHPNIYELITTLKAEASATDRTTRSASLGAQPPLMWRKELSINMFCG